MTLTVREFTEADRARWARFLSARDGARLFHDLRWSDAVTAGYGYAPRHFIAEKSGDIVGILPMALVSSPIFGRSLVSCAFATGGGIIADDADVARVLGEAAMALGASLGVRQVELRGGARPGGDFVEVSGHHSNFEKALPADPDAILGLLPRKRRAEVRKSLEIDDAASCAFRIADDARDFYKVYSRAVKALGTPVMPRKFIDALKSNFGEAAEISIIEESGDPVAALFTFWIGDRVMPYYIGAGERARALRAYDYLYYKLMRRAVERGVKVFDFGRSKEASPHHATKIHWGFEPQPITHYFGLVKATEAPNLSPANPKFERAIALWRRLPQPVADFLGPIAARNFP